MKKPKWPLPVGAKIHTKGTDPSPLHVRGHVDGHIVVRWWVRWKKRWAYGIQSVDWFEVWWRSGRMKVSIPRKKGG